MLAFEAACMNLPTINQKSEQTSISVISQSITFVPLCAPILSSLPHISDILQ